MKETHPALSWAGVAVAVLALAVAGSVAFRSAPETSALSNGTEGADHEACSQLEELRSTVADLEAQLARVSPPAAFVAGASSGEISPGAPPPVAPAPAVADPDAARPPASGPPRYVRIETTDPAVTVTQRDDGTYDVRTSDPSLAGTIVEGTAFTESGKAERFLFRVPSPDRADDAGPR